MTSDHYTVCAGRARLRLAFSRSHPAVNLWLLLPIPGSAICWLHPGGQSILEVGPNASWRLTMTHRKKLSRSVNTQDLRFNIETERETDGRWIAENSDVPGVMAYGQKEPDAKTKP